MFDFNLKPIPKAEPTFSRNAGSNISPMNPQLAYSPTSLQNNNLRNTKANLPLGGGFAFGSGSSLFADNPTIEEIITAKSNSPTKSGNTESCSCGNIQSVNSLVSRPINGFNYSTSNTTNFIHRDSSFLDSNDIEVWQLDGFFSYRLGQPQSDNSNNTIVLRQESLFIGRADDNPPLIVNSSELLNGQLRIEIRSSDVGNLYMQYYFNRMENEGWVPDTTAIKSSTPIPFETPLSSIGFVVAAQWIGINYAMENRVSRSTEAVKLSKKKKKGGEEILSTPPYGNCDDNACSPNSRASNSYPRSTAGGPCFSHDYKCTFSLLMTRDGRLYFYLPCSTVWGWLKKLFGSDDPVGIEINLLDCCQKHDINLWCATSRGQSIAADENVVDCVTSTIINQVIEKAPPGCLFFDWFTLGILTLTGYIIGKLGAIITGLVDDECLLNLDGRNSESCLCGGNRPTVMCCDECVNMCTKTGISQDCTPCNISCRYINGSGAGQGRLEKRVIEPYGIDYDPTERNYTSEQHSQLDECCVDTDPRNLESLYYNGADGFYHRRASTCLPTHCQDCYNCGWGCIFNENKKAWEYILNQTENEHNLPCCADSLIKNSFEEQECRDLNKKRSGLSRGV